MSSRPRARIVRLTQSLGDGTSTRPVEPRRRRSVLARAFDNGDPVSLYADVDPTAANDVDPTVAEPSYVALPGAETRPSEVPPPVMSTQPSAIEAAPAVAVRPSAEAPPTALTPADTAAAGPGVVDGDSGEVSGWTVPAVANDTSDQSFAEDIQAILAHAQSLPNAARVPLPDVPKAPPVPVEPAAMQGVGAGATHDVFDRMAAANAPSRYHQGPVSLGVDFDRLDRALGDITTPTGTAALSSDASAGQTPPDALANPTSQPADGATVATTPSTEAAPAAVGGGAAAKPPTAADVVASHPDRPAAAPTGAFRVVADVPLVAQAPGLSCHAAACASMVAWRDEVVPDTAALVAASGYWERYADGRTAVYPDVLEVFGLDNASIGKPPPATELRDLVDTQGPLFVAAVPPGEHAIVISGLAGDGTATGTVVDVVDPWAVGMTTYSAPNPGSRYSIPYATLLESVGAGPEHQLVIAHLRKGSS